MVRRPNSSTVRELLTRALLCAFCALAAGSACAGEEEEVPEKNRVFVYLTEEQSLLSKAEIRLLVAEEAMVQERPVYALRVLSSIERLYRTTPEIRAEIAYRQARAFHALGMDAETTGTLKFLRDSYPQSVYAARLQILFPE